MLVSSFQRVRTHTGICEQTGSRWLLRDTISDHRAQVKSETDSRHSQMFSSRNTGIRLVSMNNASAIALLCTSRTEGRTLRCSNWGPGWQGFHCTRAAKFLSRICPNFSFEPRTCPCFLVGPDLLTAGWKNVHCLVKLVEEQSNFLANCRTPNCSGFVPQYCCFKLSSFPDASLFSMFSRRSENPESGVTSSKQTVMPTLALQAGVSDTWPKLGICTHSSHESDPVRK